VMHAVHDEVLDFIARPQPGRFEALALRVFAHQFETIGPYRRVERATARYTKPLGVGSAMGGGVRSRRETKVAVLVIDHTSHWQSDTQSPRSECRAPSGASWAPMPRIRWRR